MKTSLPARVIVALMLLALAAQCAQAAKQRCRSSKVGSTTYTTCENPEQRCRSHRMGSTTYTTCDR
jgi:hypothetical protein